MAGRRRGHGEGSLYRRAGGLWVGSVDLGFDPTGKRVRKTVSSRTQAGAIEKLRVVQEKARAGLPVGDDRLTVQVLVERWLEDVAKPRVAANTYDSYRSLAERHIFPALGARQVTKLTPLDVQRFLTHKASEPRPVSPRRQRAGVAAEGRPLAPRTVQMLRGVLLQAFGRAERWGLVHRNVVRLTDPPRQRRVEGRSLTVEQAQALVAAARGHRLEATITVGLSLGLRRGELLGLRWEDVDLDAGVVQVRGQLKREVSKTTYGELKTAKSRRTLTLPAPTIQALREHRRRQREEQLGAGAAWQATGYVFTTPIGTPVDPDNFSKVFKEIAGRAGLGDWHLHELRHSCASLLLAEGIPLKVVSELLGHTNISTTADIYGHVAAPQLAAAAEAIGAAIWGKAGESVAPADELGDAASPPAGRLPVAGA